MSDGLARRMVAAKKAVQALMKHKTARLLFNAPVELPGCEGPLPIVPGLLVKETACSCTCRLAVFPADTDVVEQPMDLGTVLRTLQESEKEGWGAGATFTSPEAVHDAVQLIWDNCSQFNKSNQPVLDLCSQLKAVYEEKWQAAGLMGGGQASAGLSAGLPPNTVLAAVASQWRHCGEYSREQLASL